MSLYYEDDYVTLYHGDCLAEHREWLAADVLVTDPPYGVRMESKKGGTQRVNRSTLVRTTNAIAGDRDTITRDGAIEAWGARPAIVFGTWKVERPAGVRSLLIWHKEGAYSGPCNSAFFTNHEEIYIIGEGWRKSSPPLRSVLTSTEHRSQATAIASHPTPKPVGIMEQLIDRCPPGVIADPFAGSGATLVAARNLGRKVIGVELEEKYCELIAKRCAQDVLDIFGGAA